MTHTTTDAAEARDETFRGDNEALIASIDALLSLDDAKALVPHQLGGAGSHAYRLLCAARHRLAALKTASGAAMVRALDQHSTALVNMSEHVRVLRTALTKAHDLLMVIEQTNSNLWWVNADDPEVAVCDTLGAIEDALAAAPTIPATGEAVPEGITEREISALRYLLNWDGTGKRVSSVMKTFTLDGDQRSYTKDALESLWSKLNATIPATGHAATEGEG